MKRQPVEHPHFLDYRATILLCVAAAGLSVQRFQGIDLGFLLVTYETWPREPWRLLSACLLHANVFHLVFNLLWTWRFGMIAEPIFGFAPTIGILALLGAASSAAQWAFSDAGIGLSGIGYGLFGLLWAMSRFAPSYRMVMDQRTTELFVLWFFFCIAATVMRWMPVANVAHGVGALLGGLLGMSLSPFRKFRLIGLAGLGACILLIGAAVAARPHVNVSGRWLAYEGYEALEHGENERAVLLLERAVERDPGSRGAWHNLGVAYFRLGRMTDAARAQARAQQLPADDSPPGDPQRGRRRSLLEPE